MEGLVYRMNFIMWRVRQVIALLILFFLWSALYGTKGTMLFGYSESQMMGYVFMVGLLRMVVLSSTTWEIGANINNGNLVNILLRPLNFFSVYIAKDLGDKALNVGCAIVEVIVLVLMFRPPIFFQTDVGTLALFLLATVISIAMYFFFSMILGLVGFWTQDYWAPRFLTFVMVEFFSGATFPLDVLPTGLYRVIQFSPFPYMIYTPVKIYLGKANANEILVDIGIGILWTIIMYIVARIVWAKGVKGYEAQGR